MRRENKISYVLHYLSKPLKNVDRLTPWNHGRTSAVFHGHSGDWTRAFHQEALARLRIEKAYLTRRTAIGAKVDLRKPCRRKKSEIWDMNCNSFIHGHWMSLAIAYNCPSWGVLLPDWFWTISGSFYIKALIRGCDEDSRHLFTVLEIYVLVHEFTWQ